MSIHNLCLISASVLVLTNAANATGLKMDISPNFNNSAHTQHTLELKPISQLDRAFQISRLQFLPGTTDKENSFASYTELSNNYNRGDCNHRDSLFTRANCPSPKILGEKCAMANNLYRSCSCPSSFKYNTKNCSYPKALSGTPCENNYQYCNCLPSVSLDYTNEICTQYCGGNCVDKTCQPTPNDTNCEYDTTTANDGCGGTRVVCKGCTPQPSDTSCEYGTISTEDGCGGTRNICKDCTPKPDATSCAYGTEDADNGCGGTYKVCKSCTPKPDATGCAYGTEDADNGCGGTRNICKDCTPKPDATGCAFGTENAEDGCGGTYKVCKSCTPKPNATGCAYGTEDADDGCGGTYKVCKSCTPKPDATGCAYGTEDADNGCGSTYKACKGCTPKPDATGCAYGTEDADNGCGSTHRICKECTPKPSETGCERGTTASDDGCSGTRNICAVCTTIPQTCSGYTDSASKSGAGWSSTSCTIQTFGSNSCALINGATKYNNSCTAQYNLTSCPDNGNCISDCAGKYQLNGCKPGYNMSGNSCIVACTPKPDATGCAYGTINEDNGCGGTHKICDISSAEKCTNAGYYNMEYWNDLNPGSGLKTDESLTRGKISSNKKISPKSVLAKLNELIGIKNANAYTTSTAVPEENLQENPGYAVSICQVCRDFGCGHSLCQPDKCPQECSIKVDFIKRFTFVIDDICPHDSNYIKGRWVENPKVDPTPIPDPTPPSCGSNIALKCSGVWYCCDKRWATCSYTNHNNPNKYLCYSAGLLTSY